jgi:hypothetical protein
MRGPSELWAYLNRESRVRQDTRRIPFNMGSSSLHGRTSTIASRSRLASNHVPIENSPLFPAMNDKLEKKAKKRRRRIGLGDIEGARKVRQIRKRGQ